MSPRRGPVRSFDWDVARAMRATGLTYRAIAAELGVSDAAVVHACDDAQRERAYATAAEYQRVQKPYLAPCVDCGKPATARFRPGARCRTCYAKYQTTSVRADTLRCSICEQWLHDDAFGPSRQKTRRLRHRECRECMADRKRAERAAWDDAKRAEVRAADAERQRRYRESRPSVFTPWVSTLNPDAAKDQPEPEASAWNRGVGSGQGTIHRRTRGAHPERAR